MVQTATQFSMGMPILTRRKGVLRSIRLGGEATDGIFFAYTVETTGEVKATGVNQVSSGWLVQGGVHGF